MARDLSEAVAILKEHGLDFAKLVVDSNTQTIVRLASLLDDFFELAIKAQMVKDGEGVKERDFIKDGRFATLYKKIDRAEKKSLISAGAISDATVLRKIRNKISHAKEWLHFDSPAIEELANGLSTYAPGKPNQEAILAAHSKITEELQQVVKPKQ